MFHVERSLAASASSFQLPASSFQLPASSFQLPARFRLRAALRKRIIDTQGLSVMELGQITQ
jgi:hypothetical protein